MLQLIGACTSGSRIYVGAALRVEARSAFFLLKYRVFVICNERIFFVFCLVAFFFQVPADVSDAAWRLSYDCSLTFCVIFVFNPHPDCCYRRVIVHHKNVVFLQPFLGSDESSNRVVGRIKLGSETLATIEGHWDQEVHIVDKSSGVRA
jgi:hypothetical protein